MQKMVKKVRCLRVVADNKAAGTARAKLFGELFPKIKMAIENEFYVEAIALEESALSDRLASYLFGCKDMKFQNRCEKTRFLRLADALSVIGGKNHKKFRDKVNAYFGDKNRVKQENKFNEEEKNFLGNRNLFKFWVKLRHRAIHGMACLDPNDLKRDWMVKYREAEMAARIGWKILRSVDNACKFFRSNADK